MTALCRKHLFFFIAIYRVAICRKIVSLQWHNSHTIGKEYHLALQYII